MKKVSIYTTPTCYYCKEAKKFFQEHNIQYEEYNVLTDLKKREEMVTKSGQLGVPVIDVGGDVVVGYDKEGLAQMLGV